MVRVSRSQQPLQPSRSKPSAPTSKKFHVGAGKNLEQSGMLTETGELTPPNTLGALIALQEQGGKTTHQPGAAPLDWSENTLSLLEDLQCEILSGKLTKTSLKAVARQLETHITHQNSSMGDNCSETILELQAQIILRARVELAKLEQ